jgi:hypothetical protein
MSGLNTVSFCNGILFLTLLYFTGCNNTESITGQGGAGAVSGAGGITPTSGKGGAVTDVGGHSLQDGSGGTIGNGGTIFTTNGDAGATGGKGGNATGGGPSGVEGSVGDNDGGVAADAAVVDVDGGDCAGWPCYDFIECMGFGILGCGFTECVYLHPDTPFPFLGICK